MGKKVLLIIWGLCISFGISLLLLPYFFVGTDFPTVNKDEIPFFSIIIIFVSSSFAFQDIRKAVKHVSKFYFFIPAVFVLLIASFFMLTLPKFTFDVISRRIFCF
ncbi:hypothetical protein CXF81_00300 [Glaciecola sp. 33A]|nr:hypothetical protein CXF81_00300 [Glaciecola sp. 33A]